MCADSASHPSASHEGIVPAGRAGLYYREVGQGHPILILHGGPDFDHTYLLPELDHLSDVFRLIYYDQRGRGRSAENVLPEDVTMKSEIEDIERVREYFKLESVAVLGHSWGSLLAMEYALQHFEHVSHLILLNSAPVSREDYLLLRESRRRKSGDDIAMLKAYAANPQYQAGEPDAVAAYYRIHFRAALRKPEHLETIVQRLRLSSIRERILKARLVEDRLMDETWRSNGYDLIPRLRELPVPTLVIHGEHDFIPVECAIHIADAIPGARLAVLRDCGHFSYLERPGEVRKEIMDFVQRPQRQ